MQSTGHCTKIQIDNKIKLTLKWLVEMCCFIPFNSCPWSYTDIMWHNSDSWLRLSMTIRGGHLRYYHLVTMHTQLYPVVCTHIVLSVVRQILCPVVFTHIVLSVVSQFLCPVVCTHLVLSVVRQFLCPVSYNLFWWLQWAVSVTILWRHMGWVFLRGWL